MAATRSLVLVLSCSKCPSNETSFHSIFEGDRVVILWISERSLILGGRGRTNHFGIGFLNQSLVQLNATEDWLYNVHRVPGARIPPYLKTKAREVINWRQSSIFQRSNDCCTFLRSRSLNQVHDLLQAKTIFTRVANFKGSLIATFSENHEN